MSDKEPTNFEILQAINDYATKNDQRWDENNRRWEQNDKRWENNEGRLSRIESLMVTKDYLDDKLSDLKGDLVIIMRKEDAKLQALIDVLQKRNLISGEEARLILSMQPFPKLHVS